ncbi:nitrate regulatory gene2 protein isoform X2 [Neltuma alba]|uniref:nitrate regulatory gene2 protein isoform X2 n=1 Tax=Neltuma alba TaxID=207710 RepID=UPI0010A4F59B|nr:nitrate regulatory gene2 protein isoform X2 [Prosopis alba]
MGCVWSNMDEEGKIRNCKERKNLMKQLVHIRGFFSDSQWAYLKALKNIGVTLRQFIDSDSLELENSLDDTRPASPSLPLPSSPPPQPPPPPPPLSPDKNSSVQLNQHSLSSSLEGYIFGSSSPYHKVSEIEELETEENWAETNTEFEDEDSEKQPWKEQGESINLSMVVGVGKNSLEDIIKELDDWFLKASEGRKEITLLMDTSKGNILLHQNSGRQKTKKSDSAKVFSVLSWNRHTKSCQNIRETAESSGPNGTCKPGAHCATLKKLYAVEKRLNKLLKEEQIGKLEYEKKSSLLQKKLEENPDWVESEKTRLSVENLESNLLRLQQSISEAASSILEIMDKELYPQLVELTSGLTQMWRTMHEYHQAQIIISQRLSYLGDNQNTLLNSDYHHQATLQFETEVSYWYNSFCNLVKSQGEYVRILYEWIQRTDYLMDDHKRSGCASMIHSISEQWMHGLAKVPDKETSESIKSLLSSISSIIAQQAAENRLQKRVKKLERKLNKEQISLEEMNDKLEWNDDGGDTPASPSNPSAIKRAKIEAFLSVKRGNIEALRKQKENEEENLLKAKQLTKVMTLNSLRSSLPHLFQSLASFASAYSQAVDVVNSQANPAECNDTTSEN